MTEIATDTPTVVAPEKVARVTPPIGTDHGLAGNRYHVTTGAAGKLTEHDLTVTTSARLGVWIGYTLVAGPPADHGEVADESAMLALHDWDTDPHDVVLYHYVLPGDSCTRADDPGYRWFCLSGHGQALTDWERRPLAAPISDLRSDVDELIAEMPTKIGSAALDGYIHTDDLDTSESLTSNSSTVAPSTSAVRVYVASAISGIGGGGGGTSLAALTLSLAPVLHISAESVVVDGTAIAQANDLSGADNHLTPPFASARPTLVPAARNGRPVMRFDGIDDHLYSSSVPAFPLGEVCCIFVGAPTAASPEGMPIFVVGATGSDLSWWNSANRLGAHWGDSAYCYNLNGGSNQAWVGLAGSRPVPWSVFTGRMLNGIMSGTRNLQENTTSMGATVGASYPGFLLGGAWDAGAVYPSLFAQMDIGELILLRRNVSTTTLSLLVDMLRAKWGA